jgi:hypothetical protein
LSSPSSRLQGALPYEILDPLENGVELGITHVEGIVVIIE